MKAGKQTYRQTSLMVVRQEDRQKGRQVCKETGMHIDRQVDRYKGS